MKKITALLSVIIVVSLFAAVIPAVADTDTVFPITEGFENAATLADTFFTSGALDMRNHLPSEVITDPISMEEAYRGSLKAMLKKNVGNYVVATFLVGTQSTTSWEGILYDVGNDYMTIYQEGRDRYIVSDIYSLKFIEFYDTRCRDICDEVLRSGWMPNQGM